MMEPVSLTIGEPSREWTVFTDDTFLVQVKAWKGWGDDWKWNVYAVIFDNHPFHQNVDAAMTLPFHWGSTYEKRIVTSPAHGIRYDWEKVHDVLKLGSDYQHYDDHYEYAHPNNGIPWQIEADAEDLVLALLETKAVQAV